MLHFVGAKRQLGYHLGRQSFDLLAGSVLVGHAADHDRISMRFNVYRRLQIRLETTLADAGRAKSKPQTQTERFDLILGITCHAVYHGGQVQLIKRLASWRGQA